MQWAELNALVEEAVVEKVAAIMGDFGQGGPAVEEWESEQNGRKYFIVKIYLPNRRDLKKTEQAIISRLSALPFKVELAEKLIKPQDWFESLKQHFGIQEIGERFIVKPSWIQPKLPESTRFILELDPGASFGTGLHPTTRLCLKRLEKHLQPGRRVFDLGTGTGILSIAAARLGAGQVEAVDIDAVSVTAAKNNVRANGVSDQVRVSRGTLSAARQRSLKSSCDLVLANISGKVISALAGRLADILKPGGKLVCSGFNAQGLDEVLVSLAVAGLKIEAIDQDGDWYAVMAINLQNNKKKPATKSRRP
jgi:ribosomal protein L11 methyltransferase